MLLRLATALVVAGLVTTTEASWKWQDPTTTSLPHSASSVTSSSSSTSTSSTVTSSSSPQDEVLETAESRHTNESGLNDTDPRFLGSLKKKLCSVGLGFNGKVYKTCKFLSVDKKVRSRRDTKEDKENPTTRFIPGLFTGISSGSGLDGVKGPAIAPSFGVNFGSLPNGGGYSPYGYGNNNPLGLDLGPVSINPFVGFKVSSLDGRPIFNPSLDLLVTPNAQGVHALQGLKNKLTPGKGGLFGGHKGHYGGGYPYGHYGGGYPPHPYGGGYPPRPYGGGYPPVGGYPHGATYGHSKPHYVPPQPAYVAPQPAYVPPTPVYTPPKPVYTPPRPVYTPPRPVYTPPKPAYVPPVYTQPKPTYTPPYHRPKPVADYSTQHHKPISHVSPYTKPQEVHHHQHTHFHDHDHDHNRPYNSNSFVPSLSPGHLGRSDLFADSAESSEFLSSKTPLSSSFSPSSSSSSSTFIASASSLSPSKFSARSDKSKASSGSSSFKFPDS